ncbi:MAG: hypothetical protein IJD81_02630 [Oscillospiraceae bacterium]|nr:hypothetical protein [Oscillospiraceae bacterium]
MVRAKVYVEVYVMFDRDGNMTPVSVIWENGRIYPIDKVIDVRRCCGERDRAESMRYTISIGNSKTELFYENPAWFVERKKGRVCV